MKSLGIDIGTTTICGAVLSETNEVIEAVTEHNSASLNPSQPFERTQDPEAIVSAVRSIADRLIAKHPDIASIGLTGQMHGILYTDSTGQSVSPLYTWQDARGELNCREDESYAAYATRICGCRMASGYGLVTHFYNSTNRLIPSQAVSLCTIADYAAMKLCRLSRPIMHTSNAASIGCFDLRKRAFDNGAVETLAISRDFLPEVLSDARFIGAYRSIPVSIAIGDNQASFIGCSADADSILVNVGTGSQVSLISSYTEAQGSVELRPFIGEQYLLVGSSLSGGRAYALLESFFRSVVEMTGANVGQMYPFMNAALERYEGASSLRVSTLFDGSRDNPSQRGCIDQIGVDNFTPEALMLGFLEGIADELYQMYQKMGAPVKKRLIGSGNGIRRNRALGTALESRFGIPLTLSEREEEAACGAALFCRDAR